MPTDSALDSRAVRLGTAVALAVAGAALALVLAPPFVPDGVRAALRAAFTLVCHTIPERSFSVHGHALGVCHRCTGVYAGLALAAALFPLLARRSAWLGRHAGAVLALSLAPMGVDWLLGASGVWANTPGSRFATGLAFGLAGGVYLARAFVLVFVRPAVPARAASV